MKKRKSKARTPTMRKHFPKQRSDFEWMDDCPCNHGPQSIKHRKRVKKEITKSVRIALNKDMVEENNDLDLA